MTGRRASRTKVWSTASKMACAEFLRGVHGDWSAALRSCGFEAKQIYHLVGIGLSSFQSDQNTVNQNVYTQSPVEFRLPAVKILERSLNGAEGFGGFGELLIFWSGRPGSNRRHSAWEADVLPLNYSRASESIAGSSHPGRFTMLLIPITDRLRRKSAQMQRQLQQR